MNRRPFFYRETRGIRVTVRPAFRADQSRPVQRQFVFAYAVRIENVGRCAAQLLRRRWLIHDAAGQDTEVDGEGVVGAQPLIPPGGVHEYSSYCVLRGPEGYMEGAYRFRDQEGAEFDAVIPRFTLGVDPPLP